MKTELKGIQRKAELNKFVYLINYFNNLGLNIFPNNFPEKIPFTDYKKTILTQGLARKKQLIHSTQIHNNTIK